LSPHLLLACIPQHEDGHTQEDNCRLQIRQIEGQPMTVCAEHCKGIQNAFSIWTT